MTLFSATVTTIPRATGTQPIKRTNPWLSSLYAGLLTALAAVLAMLGFQGDTPAMWIAGLLLTGVAPVIGYGIARGQVGKRIVPAIGGLIGAIIPVVSIFLWPLLVGTIDSTQSVGKLVLGSLLGALLGALVWIGIAMAFGQDPTVWWGPAFVLLFAVWGGTVGAAMAGWARF